VETIEAGGFQTNPDWGPVVLQPPDQRLVSAGAVGETTLPTSATLAWESDDELGCADIDSTAEKNFRRQLVHGWLLELICGSGFRPGQTLGADLEHAGSKGLRFSTASKREGRGPFLRQAQPRPQDGTTSPPKRDLIVVASGNGRYKDGAPGLNVCV